MCGIAGIYNRTGRANPRINDMMDELLSVIISRGRDATGYLAMFDNGNFQSQKASCDATQFCIHRGLVDEDARSVIMHTRYATQGPVAFMENNHPVEHSGVFVTHNGVVSNDDQIFREFVLERHAKVDSEAIPALIGNFGFDAVGIIKAMEEIEGSYAIAALSRSKPDSLFIARGNSSPLVALVTDKFVVYASLKSAIVTMWKKVFGTPPSDDRFMEFKEGVMWEITPDGIDAHSFEPLPMWRRVQDTSGYSWYSRDTDASYANRSETARSLNEAIVARALSRWDDAEGEPEPSDDTFGEPDEDDDIINGFTITTPDDRPDVTWMPCDDCSEYVDMMSMHILGGDTMVCVECAAHAESQGIISYAVSAV